MSCARDSCVCLLVDLVELGDVLEKMQRSACRLPSRLLSAYNQLKIGNCSIHFMSVVFLVDLFCIRVPEMYLSSLKLCRPPLSRVDRKSVV